MVGSNLVGVDTVNKPNLWQIRKAVKPFLDKTNEVILFGCSGGADSLALALALIAEREGKTIIPVVVDHGLQPESKKITADVVSKLKSIGFNRIESAIAQVVVTDGLEASARRARYKVFNQYIDTYQPEYFFLAHTLNDQAESVLLGLARGSGARSLAAMAVENNKFIRPLLKISRATTESACEESGVEYWSDPHNEDLKYSRVRVRKNVLPNLESNLGPGITEALVRSADLLRDDADALDALARFEITRVGDDVNLIGALPRAIRSRVIRQLAISNGCPINDLTRDHVLSIDALITNWHGQGALNLPGGVNVERRHERLTFYQP